MTDELHKSLPFTITERAGNFTDIEISHHQSLRVIGADHERNAEFIARACRCHHELLETLELILADGLMSDMEELAQGAIAKARD